MVIIEMYDNNLVLGAYTGERKKQFLSQYSTGPVDWFCKYIFTNGHYEEHLFLTFRFLIHQFVCEIRRFE